MGELLEHTRHKVADDLSNAVFIVCHQELIVLVYIMLVDNHRILRKDLQLLV